MMKKKKKAEIIVVGATRLWKTSQVPSLCCRYEMPQYGSRRRLLPPAGQEEYGEVMGEAEEEEYEEEEVMAGTWLP